MIVSAEMEKGEQVGTAKRKKWYGESHAAKIGKKSLEQSGK